MTEAALEAIGINLLEQEMRSNRFGQEYCKRMVVFAKQFIEWLKIHNKSSLKSIQKKDLMAYQGWLGMCPHKRTGKPLAFSTIKHSYEAVKKLCSVLYRTGIIPENPAHGLSFVRKEDLTIKRRPLSRAEITTFLESIPADSLRNRAFLNLYIHLVYEFRKPLT